MKFFYRFAPYVLVLVDLVLWVVAAIVDQFSNLPPMLLWLPYLVIQIAISVTCGILIQRHYTWANRDVLTGLGNRRYFYDKLNEEIERLKRSISSLSLVFIDIDNFKNVNDKFGHVVGDKVLQELAVIMKQSSRVIDTSVRWGGEEFAVILTGTDLEGATSFAERLRIKVEKHDFGCSVTISIGITATTENIDIDEFVNKADNALYTAKKQKNTVVVA